MGRFTALDDPLVDQVVQTHLERIVAAVRERTQPDSIVLRGSFSRGEGSVVVRDREVFFLSDYELMVVTPDSRDREILWKVGQQLTAELGVETSLARLRPSLKKTGFAANTIMRYEMQCAGLTLYGSPILTASDAIDPRTIDGWSAMRLLLNRMAEAFAASSAPSEWEQLRLITKTALACAEAVLVVDGQYHYSYAERGRRFDALVHQLHGAAAGTAQVQQLVRCATAFKLRPALDCYDLPVARLWHEVKQACDVCFRHVTREYMGLEFGDYAELPRLYQKALQSRGKFQHRYLPLLPPATSQNMFLSLRYLHDRHRLPMPAAMQISYPAYQIVYSLVPLAFLGHTPADLDTGRHWLARVTSPKAPRNSDENGWQDLRARTAQAWKDFCYGLWETI